MQKRILYFCLFLIVFSSFLTTNPANGEERVLNYFPDGEAFVSVNGTNRFTRALYGTNTTWRLETSDVPVFATYAKPTSYNIALAINGLPLDEVEYCRASYIPGKRTYLIHDRRISRDSISLVAIPLADREAALFRIAPVTPTKKAAKLKTVATLSKVRAAKLSRAGDMGADPADSFEAGEKLLETTVAEGFLLAEGDKLSSLSRSEGEKLLAEAEAKREKLAASMRILTPDPFINTLGGAIAMAADGVWDEVSNVWQHGANGWRMPLNGWRCGYIGDCMGWTDRARTHFSNYCASQVTAVPAVIPHPAQDSTLNLARAAKIWGTQMYSDGYICRNPNRNDQMHHYDMNLVFIDALLWHILWTGDLDYAREVFPVIERHLQWEKRNFDPDDDGLYDAYCCIWASDALYYNSGAVTHSSAYNYRANKIAAQIAEKLGLDPTPFKNEAEKTKRAINDVLWMAEDGVWAEFKDFMGKQRLHTSPAVWTVYHAIDSDVSNAEQYYKATRWIDENIPHIPLPPLPFNSPSSPLTTISTTNWVPYSWSINNVAFAEVYHTALAFWQAGRADDAFRLFKANVLDGMYFGKCPGNFGQISFYDKARGECYRDFSDCVGIASRAIVQGLFGIYPDLLEGTVTIRPGFPSDWPHAELHTAYIDYVYDKNADGKVSLDVRPHFGKEVKVIVEGTELLNVDLSRHFNAEVRDIFRNQYLSPRSPFTTLQIPAQGIGDWCSPKEMAEIECLEPIAYTSLWDNYPDSIQIALPETKAKGLRLEMAGSTNHMQCRIANGVVRVAYTDGTTSELPLVNPQTWAPIEQDFYFDDLAFRRGSTQPLRRRSFKTGEVFTHLDSEFNDRHIDGGASVLLFLPLNNEKTVRSLTVETLSNDVVIGLLSAQLVF